MGLIDQAGNCEHLHGSTIFHTFIAESQETIILLQKINYAISYFLKLFPISSHTVNNLVIFLCLLSLFLTDT